MDWFLYDNGLRHEWVNIIENIMLLLQQCGYTTVQ